MDMTGGAPGSPPERPPRADTRRFAVTISDFEGPGGKKGPVITAWAAEVESFPMPKATRKYSELDTITIPVDLPEVGIKAGAVGTIVDVSPSGTLAVEISDEQGLTLDLLDVDPGPPARVIGRWHLGETRTT